VQAHDNYGTEPADHLAKEVACGSDTDIVYIKIPKSAVYKCGEVNGMPQTKVN
jgi:hypothetical protein